MLGLNPTKSFQCDHGYPAIASGIRIEQLPIAWFNYSHWILWRGVGNNFSAAPSLIRPGSIFLLFISSSTLNLVPLCPIYGVILILIDGQSTNCISVQLSLGVGKKIGLLYDNHTSSFTPFSCKSDEHSLWMLLHNCLRDLWMSKTKHWNNLIDK